MDADYGARLERAEMTMTEWIAIIRMLLEDRHKFLLQELRQLARDKA